MKHAAIKLGLATVLAIGLLGVTGGASAAVPPPSADPFYTPPAHLASYRPGKILRWRTVTAPGVNNYSAAYQLLYRSTDAKRQPIAAVTTLFLPSDPARDRVTCSPSTRPTTACRSPARRPTHCARTR